MIERSGAGIPARDSGTGTKRRVWMAAGLLLCLTAAAACSEPAEQGEARPFVPGGGSSSADLAEVTWDTPEGWVSEQPASSFRKAQYRLPRAEGDPEDGELAVFFFPGQGGTVEANVQRWIGQFNSPDGGSAADSAQTSQRQVKGKTVTLVDVSGTYTASGMGPVAPAGPPRPDYRMLAAIIDTPSGPWFFKPTGPKRTIEKWEASFDGFVGTLEVK